MNSFKKILTDFRVILYKTLFIGFDKKIKSQVGFDSLFYRIFSFQLCKIFGSWDFS